MVQCEMCGSDSEELVDALVEGVMLTVCENCARYGKVIRVKPKEEFKEIKKEKIEKKTEEEIIEIIVPDYTIKIRNAREKLNLKQEELAKNIAEKESVIHHLESGHLEPSLILARKLEKFLKIKLIEQYKEEKREPLKKMDLKDKEITIGDLVRLRRSKNE